MSMVECWATEQSPSVHSNVGTASSSPDTDTRTSERLLNVHDLASLLNVNVKWVYDHVESGLIPSRRIGRLVRFTQGDVGDWLHSLSTCGDSQGLDQPLLTVEELQEYLGVSRSWVYEARRSKRLPHYKLGALLRFARSEIDRWLEDAS